MKKSLFLLAAGLILFISCNNENKIEVIPDYNSIYLPQSELTKTPQLAQGDEEKLWAEVKKYINKNLASKSSGQSVEYILFLNEEGKIDKLKIQKSFDDEIDKIVINEISNWKFSPGKKNEQAVKSQYPLRFYNGAEVSFNNHTDYLIAAEIMPEIVGGFAAIIEKLKYPETAKQAGVQGKVFVLALIDENGNVSGAKVIKGIGSGCDEAALNAVTSVKFTPAINGGKPVKVQVTIPIFFKLQ